MSNEGPVYQIMQGMDVEFGNAGTIDTNGTGWLVGYSDWTKSNISGVANLRHIKKGKEIHDLSIKWLDHKANDANGVNKPISVGCTIALVVSEKVGFRIEFSENPTFLEGKTKKFCLKKSGDFIVWGAGLYHRWFFDEDTSILTVRWTPVEAEDSENAT